MPQDIGAIVSSAKKGARCLQTVPPVSTLGLHREDDVQISYDFIKVIHLRITTDLSKKKQSNKRPSGLYVYGCTNVLMRFIEVNSKVLKEPIIYVL